MRADDARQPGAAVNVPQSWLRCRTSLYAVMTPSSRCLLQASPRIPPSLAPRLYWLSGQCRCVPTERVSRIYIDNDLNTLVMYGSYKPPDARVAPL